MSLGRHEKLVAHASTLAPAVDVDTDVGELWAPADDPVTFHLQQHGCWEPPLGELLRARLRPGMNFLDIGAYIGYFTVMASTLVGPTGDVVAVEPDPRNGELLRANLWRHQSGNVSFLPIAAWDTPAHVWLTANPDNRAGSTVQPQYREGDIGVPAAPLDSLLDQRFDLIKVDAEGSDHIALRGAEQLLARCPLAIVEFWPETPVAGLDPARVLDCYRDLGREFAVLSDRGNLQLTTVKELLAHGPGYVQLALIAR